MRILAPFLVLASLLTTALPGAAAECGVDEACATAGASTESGAFACVMVSSYTCVSLAWIQYGEGSCSTGATQLLFVGGGSTTPVGSAQAGVLNFCTTGFYPDGPASATYLLGYVIVYTEPTGYQSLDFGWSDVNGATGWRECRVHVGAVSQPCPAGLAPPHVYPGSLL